eukprot:2578274-Heterocapsa_arctica.AAC.1
MDLYLYVCLPGFLVPTVQIQRLDPRVSPDAELPPVLISFGLPEVSSGPNPPGSERRPVGVPSSSSVAPHA